MSLDPFTILKIAGLCGAGFLFVGFCSLFVGVHKARRDFRGKGFLRPPQGTAWFRFLLWRQYEYFENPSIRLFFGTSHICLIGAMVVILAIAALVGTEYMLNGINGFSLTGPGAPTIPMP
jgi:hypothetical protein